MKKLLLTFLLINIPVNADLDLGDDFAPGDLVAAETFNAKFGKLKKVVGEIKDSDLLGSWSCTSYKLAEMISDLESSPYNITNADTGGGLGEKGPYFYGRAGELVLSELNQDASIDSPKEFLVTNYIINDEYTPDLTNGKYILLNNRIYFFDMNDSIVSSHDIEILQEQKILLSRFIGESTNSQIVCEKVS